MVLKRRISLESALAASVLAFFAIGYVIALGFERLF